MCIICYKPNKVDLPSDDTIRVMFKNNPDGAGFMYPLGGITESKDLISVCRWEGVQIKKGFMDVESFLKALHEIDNPKARPIVMHFRIATHGKRDQGATHPFPLSADKIELRELECVAPIGIAHNGIISQCCSSSKMLSDTQIFVKRFLTEISLEKGFTTESLEPVSMVAGYSNKFVLLNKYGEIALVGHFIEDGGCYYSNGTYKESKFVYNPPSRTHNIVTNTKNRGSYVYSSKAKKWVHESELSDEELYDLWNEEMYNGDDPYFYNLKDMYDV